MVPKSKLAKMYEEYNSMKADKRHLLGKVSEQEGQINILRQHSQQLEATMKSGGVCLGRNKINKVNFDGFDHMNNINTGPFLRLKMFRWHKFWPITWKDFLPNNPNSFFCKIIGNLDVPAEVSIQVYWKMKIAPMVNKKAIEIRSNFNEYVKKVYLSK